MQNQIKNPQIQNMFHPDYTWDGLVEAARIVVERNGIHKVSLKAIKALWGGPEHVYNILVEKEEELLIEAIFKKRCHEGIKLFSFDPDLPLHKSLKQFGISYLNHVLSTQYADEERYLASAGRNSLNLKKIYEYNIRVNWGRFGDFLAMHVEDEKLMPGWRKLAARQFKALLELDLVNRKLTDTLPPIFHEEVNVLVEIAVDCFLKIYRPTEF